MKKPMMSLVVTLFVCASLLLPAAPANAAPPAWPPRPTPWQLTHGGNMWGINFTASKGADATQVKLTWPACPSASYYKVYYQRGDFTKEGWDTTKVTGTSFTSPGNDTSQSHYNFWVCAVNTSGKIIDMGYICYDMQMKKKSQIFAQERSEAGVPGSLIKSINAVKGADKSQIKLSWNAVSGASYYKVFYYRGDRTKAGWDTTKVTGTTFTSLGNDTKQKYYGFIVYAINSSGNAIAYQLILYDMPK
ncbi:MAG: fibronectin type III domain-containing protein [Peptococcaceae bacterium]|nr:fibronectin type III domain-containing protein [Peptococcaceae bacterium]